MLAGISGKLYLSVLMLAPLLMGNCGLTQPCLANEDTQFEYPRFSDYKEPTFVVTGNKYYVNTSDPNASDDNDGLSTSFNGDHGPWKTIRKAAQTIQAGDVAYVRAGTYYEADIRFRNSGEGDRWIVLSAYGEPGSFEKVIIDGTGQPNGSSGIFLEQSQSNVLIQGFTVQHMPSSGIESSEEVSMHCRHIVIREVTVCHNGWAGINLNAVDGFKVDSVIAHGNKYDGIYIGGVGRSLYSKNGFIVHSRSYNNDYGPNPKGNHAHGIAVNQGHTIAIGHCRAHGNQSHGFDVSDWPKFGALSYNITFEWNTSYDNGIREKDWGAGFSVNSDSHHILFLRNLAYENDYGYLCYEGGGHLEYYHNVSIKNRDGGYYIEGKYTRYCDPGDSSVVFKNNIASNNNKLALDVDSKSYNVTVQHNNWHVSEGEEYAVHIAGEMYTPGTIAGLENDNISTIPGFLDVLTPPDVRLDDESEMVDAGTVIFINGRPEHYLGTAPDLGCYER